MDGVGLSVRRRASWRPRLLSVSIVLAAFDVDHAVGLMKDERGRHFDPDVLETFLTLVDEIVGVSGALI